MGEGVRDGRDESNLLIMLLFVTQTLKQYLKEALRMLDTIKEG